MKVKQKIGHLILEGKYVNYTPLYIKRKDFGDSDLYECSILKDNKISVIFDDIENVLKLLLKLRRYYTILKIDKYCNNMVIHALIVHKNIKINCEVDRWCVKYDFMFKGHVIVIKDHIEKERKNITIFNSIKFLSVNYLYDFIKFLYIKNALNEYTLNKLYNKFGKEKVNEKITEIKFENI